MVGPGETTARRGGGGRKRATAEELDLTSLLDQITGAKEDQDGA